MKATGKGTDAMPTIDQKTTELAAELKIIPQAMCRNSWTGVVSIISADEARACMSGHGCRPLSVDYWCSTPNAQYRLMSEKEIELVARDLMN